MMQITSLPSMTAFRTPSWQSLRFLMLNTLDRTESSLFFQEGKFEESP